jgi:hypothetical protein
VKKRISFIGFTVLAFATGFLVRSLVPLAPVAHAQASGKVYELRTYTAPEGKLGELQARFRNHTRRIFNNHHMKSVGYWVPQDTPASQNTLIYILEHPSRDEAKANWAAFQKDPEWQKVAEETQRNGKIVAKVESVFMTATDFSAIK